jgi:hypothetical protein
MTTHPHPRHPAPTRAPAGPAATSGGAARWAPVLHTNLDPQPLQQIPGQALPARAVSVAADTVWANPFPHGSDFSSRAAAVVQYGVWLAGRPDLVAAARTDLAGHDLACDCALDGSPCHRDVLLDVVTPPRNPLSGDGRTIGLTLRRPWASALLVAAEWGGKTVENRPWATDYRGPVLVYAGSRVDDAGLLEVRRAGLDADWHARQSGWLGAAVLVDVHPADPSCCRPWGHSPVAGASEYHWVFTGAARLASPVWGRGFLGLRPVSWSALLRRSTRSSGDTRVRR